MEKVSCAPGPGPFRPGTGYKNDKLYIFEPYSLTVMQPWPKPLAWRRTTRKPFRPVRPAVTLVQERPGPRDQVAWQIRRYEATAALMAGVPTGMHRKIGVFSSRQWHVMALLARCPGADDLIESTPALAYALSSNWVFAKKPVTQPMRAARSLVRQKQTAICDWLNFPARPSTINMLRKLRTCDIGICSLLQLRDILWDSERAKLLRHVPQITDFSLRILTSRARHGHFSAKFFAELGTIPYDETGNERLSTLQFAAQPWLLERAGNRVFHSAAQLVSFADGVDLTPRQTRCPPESMFPEPPLAGTETIVQIRTGQELMDEGHAMQHCCVIYHDQIMEGVNAFYRLLAPERATIALECKDGVWRLDQLSGPQNTTASQGAYQTVYGWLAT